MSRRRAPKAPTLDAGSLLRGSLSLHAPPAAPPRPRDTSGQTLLSAREVARRLGVSRGKTIAALIDAGRLETVVVNGRVRIPAREVERLAREGLDTRQSPARATRRRRH